MSRLTIADVAAYAASLTPCASVTALPRPVDESLIGDWVTAAPFRAHVRRLMTVERLPWRMIAGLAGVSDATVRTLLLGRHGRPRPRIFAADARALLELDRERIISVRSRIIPATLTRRTCLTLLEHGHDVAALADMLDLPPSRVRAIVNGQRGSVSQLLEIRALAAGRAHGIDLVQADADREAEARLVAQRQSAHAVVELRAA